MTDLTSLTLADARDALKAKKISALELTDAHLKAMEKAKALNAYVLDTPEQARTMAKASDVKLQKGDGGALEGDRKSTRLNSSHTDISRMPSSA